jgi:pyruvate dehydrogenase (quinone)
LYVDGERPRSGGSTVKTVADFILERLATWGVSRIYGYPGDAINGMAMALRSAGDQFEFVQVGSEPPRAT